MAEATLNDVILRLRTDNEKQVREQRETTTAVEELSGTIRAFLEEMEAQRLRDKEKDFESRKRATASSSAARAASSSGSGSILDLLGPGSVLGALTGIAGNIGAATIALVAATEGFGPSLKSLTRFTTGLMKFQKALIQIPAYPFQRLLGASLFEDVTKNFSKMEKVLRGRYTFDERTMRWKNLLTGKFAPFDEVNRVAREANGLLTRISDVFKSIKIPDSVSNSITKISSTLKSITIPESVTKLFTADGAIGKAFEILKNSKWITGIGKFFKPLGIILSLFDGFRTASTEMEEREGFFSKYLGGGVGGFLGGALGSFFGEFANLIKGIPLWLISWIVPSDWITVDEASGTWKFDESKNIFTKALAGIQTFDFNKLIKELIMTPIDALANAFDWIGTYMGWTGTEADQAEAQKQFDDWWNNWKSINGIAENVMSLGAAIINIALSPVNTVLNNIMQAFGMQEEGEETTFLEKMSQFVSWIYSFVPSVDDIKRKLATSIGPGLITDFLGLAEYLPMSEADFKTRSAELLGTAQESQSEIEALTARLNAAGENSRVRAPIQYSLARAQEDFDAAQKELQTMMDTARTAGGVNSSVVNNVQSQSDAIFMPNSGSIDNDDIRR